MSLLDGIVKLVTGKEDTADDTDIAKGSLEEPGSYKVTMLDSLRQREDYSNRVAGCYRLNPNDNDSDQV